MSEPRENTVIMRLMCGHLVTDDYLIKLIVENETDPDSDKDKPAPAPVPI